MDLDACEALAEKVAREAGAVIRSAVGGAEASVLKAKSTYADLVTATDKECERIIVATIKEAFPHHKFIGEEEVSESGVMPELTDEPTWMIDPVDGTTNFVHGFPFVCVCVGLCVNKRPVLGIVYNPLLEEFYKAREGKGATLNGRAIRASATKEMRAAVFATEIGTKRDKATIDATYSRVAALTSGEAGRVESHRGAMAWRPPIRTQTPTHSLSLSPVSSNHCRRSEEDRREHMSMS